MPLRFFGSWQLEVQKAIHNWENRFQITGATSGSGTFPGVVGAPMQIDGDAWNLDAQYRKTGTNVWRDSAMKLLSQPEFVDIDTMIGSEDPLPEPDFEDIQWNAKFLGDGYFNIPIRPYAVRTNDFMQMPDGIFEAALGGYYMAVRVENHWGLAFTQDHVLNITPQSRAHLAMRNIYVNDGWSSAELDALGQTMSAFGVSLDGLEPGSSRTVYFKLDVRGASPRKHDVTFSLFNRAGMGDVMKEKRYITKKIFVSRSHIDPITHEIVTEVQEGHVRVKLREIAIDKKTAAKRRRPLPSAPLGPSPSPVSDDLRKALERYLAGRRVEPHLICDILKLLCGRDCCEEGLPLPSDGKYEYPPFFAFPTKFDYTITPRDPFPGQYGPIPYDDPWWKVLLLIAAAVMFVGGLLAEGADLAYQEDENLIGKLGKFQQNDIDAAICVLDTDRALAMKTVLDAQSDEDFKMPIVGLNGSIGITGAPLTHAEIAALLMLPATDPKRKVFKSGARTGLTHGLMAMLVKDGHPGAAWTIDQLKILPDPAFPAEPTSQQGDSGSIWVQTATMRPVALNHSGADPDDGSFAFGSLLADVQTRLGITI